ncbi:MAG: hypothetical protein L3J07_00500 [Candidatus Magasanikbacteria bacterium]|nr:hypothetical protein [Candidatus Magasanikbacteria bacterium]
MSKDNDNNHGSEILELEVGGADLLFNEGEAEDVVDALAETTLVNAVVEEDVSFTVIPSRDQEEEIQNLLGALGKTGEESPEDSLQAFSKSGDDEEWKPAVVVEAEKSTTKKQAAGAHQKVEVFSSKKIPIGTPIGLPHGNTPRIRKDLGGVQEILREDGTSKLKAVPMDGNTLTAPVTELSESAQEEEFFKGGDTPPKGFKAVQKDGENRLGDTWVDEDPSWFDRNSSSILGFGIIAIVAVILSLVFLTLDIAKAPNLSTEEQTAEKSISSEKLFPPTSDSSSEEEKWTEEEKRNLESEKALSLAEENREKAEDLAEELVSSATSASPTTSPIGLGSTTGALDVVTTTIGDDSSKEEVVVEVKEEVDYSEAYENIQGEVGGLAEDVELFAVDVLGAISETTWLTVRTQLAKEGSVAETEETDSDDDLDIEFEVSDEPSGGGYFDMSTDEILALDYTNPRGEDDCVAIMSRAGSDEVGEFEGMLCCRNLQILSGKDVTDCQIRVENF